MRTALRWIAGLFVAYLLLTNAWRLVVAVGQRDWADVATTIVALMVLVWMFDTFRPGGPTDMRRRRPKMDVNGST